MIKATKQDLKYIKPHLILWVFIGYLLFLCFLDLQSFLKYKNYYPVAGYVDDLEIFGEHKARGTTSYSYTLHWSVGERDYEKSVSHGSFHPDMESGLVWVNEENDAIAKDPKSFLSLPLYGGIVAFILFILSLILRTKHMSHHPEAYYSRMNLFQKMEYDLYHGIILSVVAIGFGLFGLVVLFLIILFALKGETPSLEACEVCVLTLFISLCSGISARKWLKK